MVVQYNFLYLFSREGCELCLDVSLEKRVHALLKLEIFHLRRENVHATLLQTIDNTFRDTQDGREHIRIITKRVTRTVIGHNVATQTALNAMFYAQLFIKLHSHRANRNVLRLLMHLLQYPAPNVIFSPNE